MHLFIIQLFSHLTSFNHATCIGLPNSTILLQMKTQYTNTFPSTITNHFRTQLNSANTINNYHHSMLHKKHQNHVNSTHTESINTLLIIAFQSQQLYNNISHYIPGACFPCTVTLLSSHALLAKGETNLQRVY